MSLGKTAFAFLLTAFTPLAFAQTLSTGMRLYYEEHYSSPSGGEVRGQLGDPRGQTRYELQMRGEHLRQERARDAAAARLREAVRHQEDLAAHAKANGLYLYYLSTRADQAAAPPPPPQGRLQKLNLTADGAQHYNQSLAEGLSSQEWAKTAESATLLQNPWTPSSITGPGASAVDAQGLLKGGAFAPDALQLSSVSDLGLSYQLRKSANVLQAIANAKPQLLRLPQTRDVMLASADLLRLAVQTGRYEDADMAEALVSYFSGGSAVNTFGVAVENGRAIFVRGGSVNTIMDSPYANQLIREAVFNRAVSAGPEVLKRAFTSDGVLIPERVSRVQAASPLREYTVQSRLTESRQLIVDTANQYQSVWGATDAFNGGSVGAQFQYASGLTALRSADEAMDTNPAEARALVAWSQALLDGSQGFIKGTAEGLANTSTGLLRQAVTGLRVYYQFKHDPKALIAETQQFVMRIPDIAHAVVSQAVQTWDQLRVGNAETRGEILGRVLTEQIASWALAKGMGALTGEAAGALRMSDKGTRDIIAKVESMPVAVRGEVRQAVLNGQKELAENGIALYEQLSVSTDTALRTQAGALTAEAFRNPRRFGLDQEKLNRYQKIIGVYDAKDINTYFGKQFNYEPPFATGSVIEFSSQHPVQFYRVHGPKNQVSAWVFRKDLMDHLSLEAICERFGVEMKGIAISEVTVPAERTVWRGITSPFLTKDKKILPGGGVQYYIPGDLKDVQFKEVTNTFFRK